MNENLVAAYQRRESLIRRLVNERTDCYRLFHGAAEGRPGLTVDAYGPLTLAQVSHRSPLESSELDELLSLYQELRPGPCVICERREGKLILLRESLPGAWSGLYWCREFGSELAVQLDRARRDPQIFLDFRACKRWLIEELKSRGEGSSVLNLFAYTCSVSVHCAQAGVRELWSADFSKNNLNWGEKNFRRNRLKCGKYRFLELDCIGLLWALTGKAKALKSKGNKAKKFLDIPARGFDIVVADPPSFSKGKFANVDLNRDPESVYSPAWGCVRPGGVLVATNNSAKSTLPQFLEKIRSMLKKQEPSQACAEIRCLQPDIDFPSYDGNSPLKVVLCRKLGP